MSFLLNSSKLSVVPFFDRALPSPVRTVGELTKSDPDEQSVSRPICLTFDDGPDPVYTPKILNLLADYDVKATFFVLGQAAEQFPHLVEQMYKAGHSVGNHSYSHRHPWTTSFENAKQEVIRANTVIKNILGVTPRWFRPPFGRLCRGMQMQTHAEEMTTVLWSRSMIDWGRLGTRSGISTRLDKVEPGDIVLMHDGRPEHNRPGITYQCLPTFLGKLKEKSLVTRTLDELINEETCCV